MCKHDLIIPHLCTDKDTSLVFKQLLYVSQNSKGTFSNIGGPLTHGLVLAPPDVSELANGSRGWNKAGCLVGLHAPSQPWAKMDQIQRGAPRQHVSWKVGGVGCHGLCRLADTMFHMARIKEGLV